MSPKSLSFFVTALSFLATAAALAAPGKAVKHPPAHPAVAPKISTEDGNIGLVMGMDKNSYVVAAPNLSTHVPQIHAALTFFNHSQTPLRLYIGGAATQWQILDAQGQIVWDYSVGRAIPHNIRIVILTNSQLRYAQDIPLQTQQGSPLAPGRYTLRGAIPGALGATAMLDFTVTR